MKAICQDCGWIGDERECGKIAPDDLFERVSAGDIMPVGDCPAPKSKDDRDASHFSYVHGVCGGLCHYVPSRNSRSILLGLSFDDWNFNICILRARGEHNLARQLRAQLEPERNVLFSIGEVGFFKDGKYAPISGDEREELLGKAFRQEVLGDYQLYAIPGGHSWHAITHEDVAWDTSRSFKGAKS